MPLPDQAQVKAIIGDFEARLRVVVERAWAEWIAMDRARFVFMPRVRAVLVFDFIARHALLEFDNDPNITALKKKQTVQFLFRDQLLARFKRGNPKGVGSNILTQTVLNFIDPQGTIPGLVPEILKVEICYSNDDLGLKLAAVEVVARSFDKRAWAYPILPAASAGEIKPLPVRPPDTTPATAVPRSPQLDEQQADDKE